MTEGTPPAKPVVKLAPPKPAPPKPPATPTTTSPSTATAGTTTTSVPPPPSSATTTTTKTTVKPPPPGKVVSAPPVKSPLVVVESVSTSADKNNVVAAAAAVIKSPPVTPTNPPPASIAVKTSPPVKTPPPVAPASNVVKTPPPIASNVVKTSPPIASNVVKTPPPIASNVVKTPPPVASNVVKTLPSVASNVVKTLPSVVKPPTVAAAPVNSPPSPSAVVKPPVSPSIVVKPPVSPSAVVVKPPVSAVKSPTVISPSSSTPLVQSPSSPVVKPVESPTNVETESQVKPSLIAAREAHKPPQPGLVLPVAPHAVKPPPTEPVVFRNSMVIRQTVAPPASERKVSSPLSSPQVNPTSSPPSMDPPLVLNPIIVTPTTTLNKPSPERKVQFAEGSPQRVMIPRKQPRSSVTTTTTTTTTTTRQGMMGPFTTQRTSSLGFTFAWFYLLPLVLLLVTSPIPMLEGGDDLPSLSHLIDMTLMKPQELSEETILSTWRPKGLRQLSSISEWKLVNKASRTLLGSEQRDGHIWSSIGPAFDRLPTELASSVLIHPKESLVFDDVGTMFFCPIHTSPSLLAEEVSLMAVDSLTGQKRWNYSEPIVETMFFGRQTPPIQRAGCGTPLVLQHQQQYSMVLHATRYQAYAHNTSDGSLLWKVPTLVSESPVFSTHRLVGGLTFMPQLDVVVGLTLDGMVFALDRFTGKQMADTKQVVCEGVIFEDAAASQDEEEEDELIRLRRGENELFQGPLPFLSLPMVECVLAPLSVQGNQIVVVSMQDGIPVLSTFELAPKLDYYDVFPFVWKMVNTTELMSTTTTTSTTTTPAVIMTPGRIAIGNDAGQVLFVCAGVLNASLTLQVNASVVSLAYAMDEHSLYVATRFSVSKFEIEEEDVSLPVWVHDFSESALFPSSSLVLTPSGVAVAVDAKRREDEMYLGIHGLVLLDRETGLTRNTHTDLYRGESISQLAVGVDGSVFGVLHPFARAKYTTLEEETSVNYAYRGGVVRFRARHLLDLSRDAACAAKIRIEHALQFEPGWFSTQVEGSVEAGMEEAKHALLLARQAFVAGKMAKNSVKWRHLQKLSQTELLHVLDTLGELIKGMDPSVQGFAALHVLQPAVLASCDKLVEHLQVVGGI